MAIINPEHLFEQAESLIGGGSGRPRQADIRRAISAAYYALFHAVITAAADEFVGAANRDTIQYGLAYRSVDHRWLKELCNEIRKPTLSKSYKPYEPPTGFGKNVVAFAVAAVELQEKRHTADYDVLVRVNRSDATMAVRTARAALRRLQKAGKRRRLTFLGLLLFRPRR